jgi:phosphatidylglycerophosphate synthase
MPLSRNETRSLAQDHPHLLADPTYARLVMRRISPPVTYALVRWTPLSADAVTLLAIASGLMAAGAVLVATPAGYVVAALLLQLAYLFDTVDGEVARVRRTAGKRGTYLDLIGHVLQNRALYAAGSVALLRATGSAPWALAIAFIGLALASPYGEQARAQVLGTAAGLPAAHGAGPAGPASSGSSPGAILYRLYRRLAFLWSYPASMNLFSLALLADAIRMTALAGVDPLLLPAFTAVFLGSLAAKQTANALRLLNRRVWAGS